MEELLHHTESQNNGNFSTKSGARLPPSSYGRMSGVLPLYSMHGLADVASLAALKKRYLMKDRACYSVAIEEPFLICYDMGSQ